MSSNSSLPLNSLLGTLSCNFTPHIHLTILISEGYTIAKTFKAPQVNYNKIKQQAFYAQFAIMSQIYIVKTYLRKSVNSLLKLQCLHCTTLTLRISKMSTYYQAGNTTFNRSNSDRITADIRLQFPSCTQLNTTTVLYMYTIYIQTCKCTHATVLYMCTIQLVSQQRMLHLNEYDPLPSHQSAYRVHHSMETAVLRVLLDILLTLDSGNIAVLAQLDLSAAFDSVNHTTLLQCTRGPLCGKTTSSTKPEVHSTTQCCQRRTEPRPQATCRKKLAKFNNVIFKLCKQTDRKTEILISHHNTFTPRRIEVIIIPYLTKQTQKQTYSSQVHNECVITKHVPSVL